MSRRSVWAASFRRLGGLAKRYRVDGRLPAEVYRLLADAVRLRARREIEFAIARVTPVRGKRRGTLVATEGTRRFACAAELSESIDRLATLNATRVVGGLEVAGIECWLVDREGHGLQVGVAFEDREAAWDAISELFEEPGWHVRMQRGKRSHFVSKQGWAARRRARRATEWYVFRLFRLGTSTAGRDAAVLVTFWALGTSGQNERVGTRGQHRFPAESERTIEIVDGRELPGRSAFPVRAALDRFDGDIDVVFTWVDGSDPAWLENFARTVGERHRETASSDALGSGRFADRDELRHAMRAVYFNCGWVRKIFLVTADQCPAWLAQNDRVVLVPHTAILPADCLPTFNSHAIESALHRIDGLSEHFIYFNDDVFVARPRRPENFFTPSGLPLVFQSDARVPPLDVSAAASVDTAAQRGAALLESRFERKSRFKPLHVPFPLRTSVLFDLEKEFGEEIQRTREHRVRSPDDLSVASSLAQHYGIATGRAVLGSIRSDYVSLETRRIGMHLDRLLLSHDFDGFCLNETDVGFKDEARIARRVSTFLSAYYPQPAPWEKHAS